MLLCFYFTAFKNQNIATALSSARLFDGGFEKSKSYFANLKSL
jgi:hypothetical protein